MALHLSSSSGTVGQTVAQANDFTVHALRRDSEGMLHYTKARSTEDDVFDFHRLDGEQYENFLQGTDYVTEPSGAKVTTTDPDDKYQQFRFDFRNILYFIDDEGYLVARLNKTYDYTTNGPK
tara:strand:- start:845 stop:1210 length:366 start_codon:yes stop_codon:yes gene_type:complete